MDDSEAVDPGACFLPEQLSRLESGDLLKLSPVTRVIDDAGADRHVDTSVGKVDASRRHSVGKERSEEHTDRSSRLRLESADVRPGTRKQLAQAKTCR